jgi:hypothetical protein
MTVRTIQVAQNALNANREMAERSAGVAAVNSMASPGSGKTSPIGRTSDERRFHSMGNIVRLGGFTSFLTIFALAFALFSAPVVLAQDNNGAANAAGATGGKMISPQSIAVATAATGLVGSEGELLNQTRKYCICYVVFLGVFVYLGSTHFVGR